MTDLPILISRQDFISSNEFKTRCLFDGQCVFDELGAEIFLETLHTGWDFPAIIKFRCGYVGILTRGEERALWFFDKDGIRIGNKFGRYLSCVTQDFYDMFIELLTFENRSFVHAGGGQNSKLFYEFFNDAVFHDVILEHISSLNVTFVNHEERPSFEFALGLHITDKHLGLRPVGVRHLGDAQIFFDALSAGCIRCSNPVTNAVLSGDKSLYVDNYLIGYPVANENEFAFLLGCGSSINAPYALYYPKSCVLYLTNRMPMREQILNDLLSQFICYIFKNYSALMNYMNNKGGALPAPMVFISHIGHHLWNELSGLERVASLLPEVKKIYIHHPDAGEHFGKIEDLFHLSNTNVERLRDPIFPNCAYENNEIILRLNDSFIDSALSDRICKLAFDKEADFRSKIEADSAKYQINILVSPRFENRCWINQLDELIDSLNYFCGQGFAIRIFIDGHNSNDGRTFYSSHNEEPGFELIQKEQSFARSLLLMLDDKVSIVDNIGGSVFRSIVLARMADFFVIPWGAAMAKYKWAANSWGIVASNNFVLTEKGDRYIYEDQIFVSRPTADIWFRSDDVIDDVPRHEKKSLYEIDRGNFSTVKHSLRFYIQEAISRVLDKRSDPRLRAPGG